MSALQLLLPDWPVPPSVRAAFTLRAGGVSSGCYASLNLGQHVGDDAAAVAENRRRVAAGLMLPAEPLWLSQVHGSAVVAVDRLPPHEIAPPGDAALPRPRGRPLAAA